MARGPAHGPAPGGRTLSRAQFRALDLNLLKVFDALLEEQSVTAAAGRLGLTPSAVSHALARLRHMLGDELFVRGSSGMQPTRRAEQMGPGLRQALLQLQQALDPPLFVPAETERQFTLACGDYVASVLLPALVRQLRAEAPGAELRVRPIGPAIVEDLDAGRVELVLGGFERVPERFAVAPLFADTMVWALGRDHPAAAAPLTLERLVELPQLIVATGEDEHAVRGVVLDHGVERRVLRDDAEALDAALAKRGLRRRVSLTVPNGPIAARIAADGEVAALLPRRIAAAHTDRLALFEPPYPAPPFEIAMLWHRRLGDEPAIDWLRGLLQRVALTL